ncbi:hypothetical protein [Streptomyces antibioticus]|uniref:hypothetical protein n=1 Tax=Streptomyces antibioticus TaxID=1890 RepID=UPI003D72F789
MYEPTTTDAAPAVYQPQPLHAAPVVHQAHPLVPAADPRRALVQLDTGQWVTAYVPPAPPLVVPAAPDATPRRPLSALERGAIVIVSSVCALTLSAGGALAMAGPYLAAAADFAFGTAAVLGTAVAAFLGLRLVGRSRSAETAGSAPAAAPAPVTVNVTGTGGQGGRWGSRGGTGVHIDRLTINNR